MKVIEIENNRVRVRTRNELPTKTQQQFKEQVDVNNIIRKYKQTGAITHLNTRKGVYMDCTAIPDYQVALNTINQANSAFMELPAIIRARFQNDPAQLLEFLKDPQNKEEGIKLGLLVEQNKNDLNETNTPPPSPPQTPSSTPS